MSKERFVVFLFGIEGDHRLTGFSEVGEQELHEERFPLAGVTEDEDIAVCFIVLALIKVHEDVRSVAVLPDAFVYCQARRSRNA